MRKTKIISASSYLPKNKVTNHDIEKMVDTSDEWIYERTGIKERRIISNEEKLSDMAYKAAKQAIDNIDFDKNKIDGIILATTTADRIFPASAAIVQAKLAIDNIFAFDIQAVCSGFLYGLELADNMIKSGKYNNILVIGADSLSRIVDWTDRNSCILFGDGAGAVILSHNDNNNSESNILSSEIKIDGNYADILKTNDQNFIEMNGKEVFKHAVSKMTQSIKNSLIKAKLTIEDVDLLIPHQANIRILKKVASNLSLDIDKSIITIENQGNTSAASIPLAIDFALKNNKIKDNDIIVLTALGGGISWGSMVIKW